MRHLFVLTSFAAAAFAPVSPASATHCEVDHKGVKVCVCLTVVEVVRDVTGEDWLHCA